MLNGVVISMCWAFDACLWVSYINVHEIIAYLVTGGYLLVINNCNKQNRNFLYVAVLL